MGCVDLAVRAIELYFSALVGDFQDSVFTTPSSFSNVGALGCNPGMEENTGQGQRQDEGGLDEKRRVIFDSDGMLVTSLFFLRLTLRVNLGGRGSPQEVNHGVSFFPASELPRAIERGATWRCGLTVFECVY